MIDPNVDFKDLTFEQLKDAKEKLEDLISKAREGKKKDALKQIQAIVKEYDLSYEEVVAVVRTTTRRGKAPAIYRNPANPRQTWSGKGETPAWYATAKDKEALRIPGA